MQDEFSEDIADNFDENSELDKMDEDIKSELSKKN